MIKNDRMLNDSLDTGSLIYENNNWVEWNLFDPSGTFHDLFLIVDNVLEDNVLDAFAGLQYYIDEVKKYRAYFEGGAKCV